jgi:hypothetical protein
MRRARVEVLTLAPYRLAEARGNESLSLPRDRYETNLADVWQIQWSRRISVGSCRVCAGPGFFPTLTTFEHLRGGAEDAWVRRAHNDVIAAGVIERL